MDEQQLRTRIMAIFHEGEVAAAIVVVVGVITVWIWLARLA